MVLIFKKYILIKKYVLKLIDFFVVLIELID